MAAAIASLRRAASLSPPSYSFAHQQRASRPPLAATLDRQDTSDFFMDDTIEKEWSIKPPSASPADSFQRARLAEQLRLSAGQGFRVAPPTHLDGASRAGDALSLLSSRLAADVLQPVLNPQIEKDVPARCILGAAANGSSVAFFALLIIGIPLVQTLVAALSMAVIAAYLSITRGAAGDFVRQVGRFTMTAADSAIDMYRDFDAARKVKKASKALDTLNRVNSDDRQHDSAVRTVLDAADRAVKEVQRAEAELERAALRRKKALADATDKLAEVERTKNKVELQLQDNSQYSIQDNDEAASVEVSETPNRNIMIFCCLDAHNLCSQEENNWLEEQNRLANERHLARIQKERGITNESAALKRNPVDYYAPARLAYEKSGKSVDFDSFLRQYLASTSAMIAQKHQCRLDTIEADKDALTVKRDAERIMSQEDQAMLVQDQLSMDGELEPLDDYEINQEDWDASIQLANVLAGLEDDVNRLDTKPDDGLIDSMLKVEMGDLTEDEEELLGKAAREAVRKYEEEMMTKKSAKVALQSSWDNASKEDYSQLTVAELKKTLRSKGLKVSGNKSELIKRLNSNRD